MLCFAPFLAVYYLPHSLSKDFRAFFRFVVEKFHLANPTFHFASPEGHLNAKWAQFFCRKWELRHRGMWEASAHGSAPRSLPQCECRVITGVGWWGRGTAVWHVLTSLCSKQHLEEDNPLSWCTQPPASTPSKDWHPKQAQQDFPSVRCHLETVAWQQSAW